MTRLMLFAAFGLVGMGLSACAGSHPAAEPQAGQPIAVSVVPAAAADTAERLEAGGILAAQESAVISSRIVATILTVHVRAGDRVAAGDVLVTLDARDVGGRTQQARAGALAAEKALAQARTEQTAAESEHRLSTAWHTRIVALHARNSATDQERDEAEARLAAAAARLDGAKAGIEAADARLASARADVGVATTSESFTVLRAPFDGLVTERLTDPGNLAAPGIPLLRVESSAVQQVSVRVDEARATYVRSGDAVGVAIDALDSPLAESKTLEGVVTEVARAMAVDPRAFTIKVTLPRPVMARSGTFARVFFPGAPRHALFVPATAIQRHGQVTSVFVVKDGVARLRLVQAGLTTAAGVDVLAGVEGGELIVTAPPPNLVDGCPVIVRGDETAAEAKP